VWECSFVGSAAIIQTLGVKYALQWTLRHYDLVIGESPLILNAEEIVSEVLVVFEFFHFMWALLMKVVSMF
jgi:hypothetical protein